MNDAQRNTIVTVLSNEIVKASVSLVERRFTSSSYDEDKAYYDHLWDTLKAFDDMWDNLQMVKEASNE